MRASRSPTAPLIIGAPQNLLIGNQEMSGGTAWREPGVHKVPPVPPTLSDATANSIGHDTVGVKLLACLESDPELWGIPVGTPRSPLGLPPCGDEWKGGKVDGWTDEWMRGRVERVRSAFPPSTLPIPHPSPPVSGTSRGSPSPHRGPQIRGQSRLPLLARRTPSRRDLEERLATRLRSAAIGDLAWHHTRGR